MPAVCVQSRRPAWDMPSLDEFFEQPRQFLADCFVSFMQLVVMRRKVAVARLQFFVSLVSFIMLRAVTRLVVMLDGSFVRGNFGFVLGDLPFVFEQVRLVIMELGLDASQGCQKATVFCPPRLMISPPSQVIGMVSCVVFSVRFVSTHVYPRKSMGAVNASRLQFTRSLASI